MQPRSNEQIKQIIPAHEGYYAVLLDAEEPYYRLERVVGWALIEFEDADSERRTRIAGLSLLSGGFGSPTTPKSSSSTSTKTNSRSATNASETRAGYTPTTLRATEAKGIPKKEHTREKSTAAVVEEEMSVVHDCIANF